LAYVARLVCGAVAKHACLAGDYGSFVFCWLVIYTAYGARLVCGAVAKHACLAVCCCLFLFIGFVVSGVFNFIRRIVSTFCNGLQSFSGSFVGCW
jgi:hypothetical protein